MYITCLFDILHTSFHIICIYVRSMSSSKPCFSLTFSPGDYRFAAFQGRWRLDFGESCLPDYGYFHRENENWMNWMDLEVQDFQTTDVLVILGASMVLLEISGDDPLNLPFALFVKRFSVGAEEWRERLGPIGFSGLGLSDRPSWRFSDCLLAEFESFFPLVVCFHVGHWDNLFFFKMFPLYIQIYRRTEIHHIHDIYIYMKYTW